jgi:hypothetical protein
MAYLRPPLIQKISAAKPIHGIMLEYNCTTWTPYPLSNSEPRPAMFSQQLTIRYALSEIKHDILNYLYGSGVQEDPFTAVPAFLNRLENWREYQDTKLNVATTHLSYNIMNR